MYGVFPRTYVRVCCPTGGRRHPKWNQRGLVSRELASLRRQNGSQGPIPLRGCGRTVGTPSDVHGPRDVRTSLNYLLVAAPFRKKSSTHSPIPIPPPPLWLRGKRTQTVKYGRAPHRTMPETRLSGWQVRRTFVIRAHIVLIAPSNFLASYKDGSAHWQSVLLSGAGQHGPGMISNAPPPCLALCWHLLRSHLTVVLTGLGS
jgi:hypothetical protein